MVKFLELPKAGGKALVHNTLAIKKCHSSKIGARDSYKDSETILSYIAGSPQLGVISNAMLTPGQLGSP